MDYHIYIHSKDGGSNPTNPQPKPKTPTLPALPQAEEESLLPFSASIKIAAVVAVAKVVEKATSYVSSYMARETGDYVFQRNFSNMMSLIGSLTNPIGTVLNAINIEQQQRLGNQRLQEQRVLFGDSYINKGIRRV